MSEENKDKLNTTSEETANKEAIDEIMNGFYDLANIYSQDAAEREKALKEREERRRKREMDLIRADIERRYALHLENAVNNAEEAGSAPKETKSEEKTEDTESPETIIPVTEIAESDNETEAEEVSSENQDKNKQSEKKKKDNKAAKKRKKKSKNEVFVEEDKNGLYLAIYNYGDIITKAIGAVLALILKVILYPFKKLKEIIDILTSDAKKRAKKTLKATLREADYFRLEIKSAHRSIKKGLKHPLALPGILKHYIKKAFSRHSGLLKTAANLLLPIVAIFIMVSVFSYWKGVTFALEVVYNDEGIGYISDESVFIEAREMVIDQLSAGGSESELTTADSGSFNAGYKLALVSLDELSDAGAISDTMIEKSSDKFTNACGVYIDGEFICAIKNESDAKTVFYSILEPYEEAAEKGNYIVGFAENIDYVQGLYRDDAGIIWDASKLEETLLGKEGATMTYTVVDNDTISTIAYNFGTTEEEIYALNPGLSAGMLHTGTNISVPSYTPLVRIKKTVTSSTTRTIEFDTIKQRDATKYSGYRLVKQTGVDGKERVITTKIYISGELYNTEYTFETIKEPVDEIVVVGSRTTYGGVYIGEASDKGFLWPAPSCHYVSSPYGWRSSGWHKGIDLCTGNGTAYGTPVIASKSGRVEAVQRSNSGYGNMVLINHGDGYKTRYAHMVSGSITVKVGDYVEAGKTIGRVGSTGNSSGPHLHFEVIYNGETQDPKKYIS